MNKPKVSLATYLVLQQAYRVWKNGGGSIQPNGSYRVFVNDRQLWLAIGELTTNGWLVYARFPHPMGSGSAQAFLSKEMITRFRRWSLYPEPAVPARSASVKQLRAEMHRRYPQLNNDDWGDIELEHAKDWVIAATLLERL